MIKIILTILAIAYVVFAKPFVFDVCTDRYCYVVKTPDAKSWKWETSSDGSRFVRVFLLNGMLDISDRNAHSIKLRP